MKEFILLFRGGNTREVEQSPEQVQAYMQKWVEWMGGITQQDKFVGAQPLISTGKTISGTKKVVSDGPFMEGKELIGGYLICKADNYDEAVEISMGCPILEHEDGSVEVREVREMQM